MRVLVYVHGVCKHSPGYSDPWWATLQPFTEVYGAGILGETRFEVQWSDLLNHGGPLPTVGCLQDFTGYQLNSSTRAAILERFTSVVQPLLVLGNEIDIISHSEGTVVSFEGLQQVSGSVLNWFTCGAALALESVKNNLWRRNVAFVKPPCVARWWNLAALGDPIGGALAQCYQGVTQDFLGLAPTGCTTLEPICCHGSYFNAQNIAVNQGIFAAKINGVTQ